VLEKVALGEVCGGKVTLGWVLIHINISNFNLSSKFIIN